MKNLISKFFAVLFLLNLSCALGAIFNLEWWLLVVNIILVFPLSGAIIWAINKTEKDVHNQKK